MKNPLITMSALVGKLSDEARQVEVFEGLLNTQRDRFVCSFFVALFPQKHGKFMEFLILNFVKRSKHGNCDYGKIN